jgi:hypothetical protein
MLCVSRQTYMSLGVISVLNNGQKLQQPVGVKELLRLEQNPRFYWVKETWVEVWENEKCCGNTSTKSEVFHISSSSKLSQVSLFKKSKMAACAYTLWYNYAVNCRTQEVLRGTQDVAECFFDFSSEIFTFGQHGWCTYIHTSLFQHN